MNGHGELGQGNTVNIDSGCDLSGVPAIDLGTDFVITAIGCGSQNTCALGENPDDIKCFGKNYQGEVKEGPTALVHVQ